MKLLCFLILHIHSFLLGICQDQENSSQEVQPTKTSVFNKKEFGYFTGRKVHFQTAKSSCTLWNSSLALIKDHETQQHLERNMRRSKNKSFFYIGLKRMPPAPIIMEKVQECIKKTNNSRVCHSRWMWLDGSVLTTTNYNNWNKSDDICKAQPNGDVCCNNKTDEDRKYVQMSNEEGQEFGKWFDKVGDSQSYFICEREFTEVRTSTEQVFTSLETSRPFNTLTVTAKPQYSTSAVAILTLGEGSDRNPWPNVSSSLESFPLEKTDVTINNARSSRKKTTSSPVFSTFFKTASKFDAPTTSHNDELTSIEPAETNALSSGTSGHRKGTPATITLPEPVVSELMEKVISNMINNFSLRSWEHGGAKSLANYMWLQNDTDRKSFHRNGLIINILVLSPDERGAMHGDDQHKIKFSKNSSDEFRFYKSKTAQPSVVVAASFSSYLWKKNHLSSVFPAMPLEAVESATKADSTLKFLSHNTSILSFSLFAHSEKQGGLIKISVPVHTVFDLSDDHTAVKFQKFNRKITPSGITAQCCYLDAPLDSTFRWSYKGCKAIETSSKRINCFCNHTTSFGILLAIRSVAIPPAVNVFTVVVEVISTVALAVTSSLLLWLRQSLQSDRTWIQINLSLSLMMLHLFFLLGNLALKIGVPSFCEAVTALSHFFTISSAVWMLNEGFVLYMKTCKHTLKFSLERIQRRLVVAGWAIPCLYVGACAAVGLSVGVYMDESAAYRQEKDKGISSDESVAKYDHCWLSFTSKMIYVAIVPLALIFSATTALLIRTADTVRKMTEDAKHLRPRIDIGNKKIPSAKSDAVHQVKLALNAVVTLIPVLGVPWLFGFLVNVPSAEIPFLIIHGVLNGLQGLFVFFIYCVKNEKFRGVFRRKWLETSIATHLSSLQLSSSNSPSTYAMRSV